MRVIRFLLLLCLCCCLPVFAGTPKNVGFYYGHEAPIGTLFAYDWLVLQADQVSDARIDLLNRGGTRPLAYVAVDEIHRSHPLASRVESAWEIGRNTAWNSVVLDIRLPAVRSFLLEQRVAPAMARGFSGVFLDTLDSHLLTTTGQQKAADFATAQAELIKDIRDRYPDALIIINRGFHLPEQAHERVDALAFESWFEGYEPAANKYRPVPTEHREWLQLQLAHWRATHPDKPLIAIDYTAAAEPAVGVANRLREAGFIPVVSNSNLDRLGPTQPEVVRRQVLVLHDLPREQADQSQAHSRLGIFLEYLGLIPVYRSALEPALQEPVSDRYQGVVVWWEAGVSGNRLCQWLGREVKGRVPLVLMGLVPGSPACQRLVSDQRLRIPQAPVEVQTNQASVGTFEGSRMPNRVPLAMPSLSSALNPWVTLVDSKGAGYSPVFTGPQGGVALGPFLFEPGPDNTAYWLFDPVSFLVEALQPGLHPGVDTTTESGRRVMTAHIDGDGFVSRARRPGAPQAAEVVLEDILKEYRLPHTVSVIEAEISPGGLFPAESKEAMATARKIFRQPLVEVASHTFSHPFFWRIMEGEAAPDEEDTDYGFSMDVPGYLPELEREIPGSVDFIQALAPEQKDLKVFLWSGDARPGRQALKMTRELGLFNVNGGNTQPLSYSSMLAAVWPDGRLVEDEFQVHAPVLNENVYTNLWTGPFYGYRNVRESFDLLNKPYRLKPSGIYYHFYSGVYPESVKALHEVYQHVLSEPNTPLYLSEYAARVQSRYYSTLTLSADRVYRWRGVHHPGTVTVPEGYFPDLERSQGVAGFIRDGSKTYIHLAGSSAALVLAKDPPEGPFLESANGPLTAWSRQRQEGGPWRIELSTAGHVPLELQFAPGFACRVASGHQAKQADRRWFRFSASQVSGLVMECR
ncbi:polysaccharide biosynthesis protein [Marinobacter fuscus]|uniref:Polysaccharide biosynthesis protein n=1 Tax=Marinobacter fuscus TaxID=2109942 RepID=A0A2T1K5V5_9GAMM|nr:polysaccharide biosynthesis protein [Marinobacter fuscus]